ncbi:retrovirus-related pol polyprotein from transposon TNT 1-94 [Tanacetum coccineum]
MSSEFTQSPSRSSYTSKGSENSRSFEDCESQIKKILKTEHPTRKEAPKIHSYEGPTESPGLCYEDDYNQVSLEYYSLKGMHLEPLDVKTTFLHGDLNEDIYMAQPIGFQSAGKEENLVCKLKKILYGLKQAPRQWPNIAHAVGVVTRFMSNLGREHCEAVKWLLRYLKGTSKATLCFTTKSKEPSRYAHQGGDNREVEALRSFNWPLR